MLCFCPQKIQKKLLLLEIVITLGFWEFTTMMTWFVDTNKWLFLTKGMYVSFYLWIDLYYCYSLMRATLWHIYKRLPYENMSRPWILWVWLRLFSISPLPVGRGTRPTGNGEIENSLSHTHKIHWPADPDWSMVVACEGLKAPPTRVNSSLVTKP